MPATEKEALLALSEAFEERYVVWHPQVHSAVPDAMTLSFEDFELCGFEIKNTRQDWLAELRSNKNLAAIEVSDFWAIIGDPDIVRVEDLPSRWGLYCVKEGRLICRVEPQRLRQRGDIPRNLAARLLRHVAESIPMEAKVRQAKEQAYAQAITDLFGSTTLQSVGPERLGALLKMLDGEKHLRAVEGLQKVQADLGQLYNSIEEQMGSLPIPKAPEQMNEFAPDVLAYGEQVRKRLIADKKTAGIAIGYPEVLERMVWMRMRAYSRMTFPKDD